MHGYVQTNIGERWDYFDQMRMINTKVIKSDTNVTIYSSNNNDKSLINSSKITTTQGTRR